MVLNTIVDMMCTYGIEYCCRHDAHKDRCDGKEEEEKINKVNTMTTIETISWSKTENKKRNQKALVQQVLNIKQSQEDFPKCLTSLLTSEDEMISISSFSKGVIILRNTKETLRKGNSTKISS